MFDEKKLSFFHLDIIPLYCLYLLVQEEAQNGLCVAGDGSSLNAQPESTKISLALLYGKLSFHAHKFWLKEVAPLNM